MASRARGGRPADGPAWHDVRARDGRPVGRPANDAVRTLRELSSARPVIGARERGAVTAETAMVLPVLIALTLVLVWFLTLGAAQIRAVDAARETARSLARDDPEGQARDLGRRAAPDGAVITTLVGEDRVEVTVTAVVSGPGGLLGRLPGATVRATAIAVRESASP